MRQETMLARMLDGLSKAETREVLSKMKDEKELARLVAQQLEKLKAADGIDVILREVPQDSLSHVATWDVAFSAALLGGIMTDPLFQPNWARLQALSHIVVSQAHGTTLPTSSGVSTWLNEQFADGLVPHLEDPAEDVCVGNVVTRAGNHRLFCGNWDAADFWLQDLIDTVYDLASPRLRKQLSDEVDSFLRLSEAVAARVGVRRFVLSEGMPGSRITFREDLDAIASRVIFSRSDLDSLGIRLDSLLPFTFDMAQRERLRQQKLQSSDLQFRPLLKINDKWILAIPSAVSAALRTRILWSLAQQGDSWRACGTQLRLRQENRVF